VFRAPSLPELPRGSASPSWGTNALIMRGLGADRPVHFSGLGFRALSGGFESLSGGSCAPKRAAQPQLACSFLSERSWDDPVETAVGLGMAVLHATRFRCVGETRRLQPATRAAPGEEYRDRIGVYSRLSLPRRPNPGCLHVPQPDYGLGVKACRARRPLLGRQVGLGR
jgi:hypothetical protein